MRASAIRSLAGALLLASASGLLLGACQVLGTIDVSSVSDDACRLVRLDQAELATTLPDGPPCVVLIYDGSMPGVTVQGDVPALSPADARAQDGYASECFGSTESHDGWRFGDLPGPGPWAVSVIRTEEGQPGARAVCDRLVAPLGR